ncbi:Actin-like protein 7B [Dissostichus eleginoides]|uniref:Actin-like protein 7B n=1 Tax=Dissostichus eleginoides TaxID=100907 RepID=A0AAD9ERN9_DISEL|nr:Actin-like protein 7B [Dissostichus eleginoides]
MQPFVFQLARWQCSEDYFRSNTEGCSLFNLPESTSNIILRDSQKTRTVPTLRMLQLSASRNHHLQNT